LQTSPDNFIKTRQLRGIYRDFCKNRSSRGATYYTAEPLVVSN
jgi:hypothetical protein